MRGTHRIRRNEPCRTRFRTQFRRQMAHAAGCGCWPTKRWSWAAPTHTVDRGRYAPLRNSYPQRGTDSFSNGAAWPKAKLSSAGPGLLFQWSGLALGKVILSGAQSAFPMGRPGLKKSYPSTPTTPLCRIFARLRRLGFTTKAHGKAQKTQTCKFVILRYSGKWAVQKVRKRKLTFCQVDVISGKQLLQDLHL